MSAEDGLAKALAPWIAQGYRQVAYEEVPLPLEGTTTDDE